MAAARLNGAAHAGDTNGLHDCIRDDVNVLRRIDRAEFVDTPLHIAAAGGHVDFAMEIMCLKPSFARKLNPDCFSPMHLALQNDHKEMVLCLLAVDKDLARIKGKEGYTPLHHAVREGKLDLLAQFLKDCPTCIEDVTIRDESAFHIAAQNNRFDALEILAELIRRTPLYGKISRKQLLNLKDRDGNTVLHIAAANSQPQMIKLLLKYHVDTKETNKSGLTALNVLENQTRSGNRDQSLKILHDFDQSGLRSNFIFNMIEMKDSILSMSPDRINALLVVFTLILTITYQAMINPPGEVWQGDLSGNLTEAYMVKVGTPVMDESSFNMFFGLNLAMFSVTYLLTVGLLQIATKSWTFMATIVLLTSYLISSLFAIGIILEPFGLPGSEGTARLNFLSWKLRFIPIITYLSFVSRLVLPLAYLMDQM